MRVVALTTLLFAAFSLEAMTYRVEWRGAGDAGTAVLHARRVDGTAEPIRREIAVPSTGSLSIDEGTWQLSLESERAWAPPVYVQAGNEPRLIAWPAARVRARFGKSDAVPEMTAVLLTPAQLTSRGEHLEANVECPIRENEILCTLPAGTWDIQFAPAGFVPQYRWNVQLPVDRVTTLETIPLVKGASVIGTVMRADPSLPLPPDTVVRLMPLSREVKPNAKGFFQLAGIPPGEYVLSASAKSLTSDSRRIVVIANRIAELRSPLVIDVPRRVRVAITPKVDPEGKPWLAELMVQRRGAQMLDTYTQSKANADGVWEQKNLPDGEYLLSIARSDGTQWASQWLTVAGGDLEMPIEVAALQVEGTISYGDRPIAARLTFGGELGPRRQLLVADDEGKFAGIIPKPEKEPWDVYVEADSPRLRLTLHDVRGERKDGDPIVRFDVKLPRTAVIGNVVHSDGTPAEFALLTIEGEKTFDQISAEKDGSFQISGLRPGSYRIHAEDFLETSDVVRYEIGEEENAPLRLVLRSVQQIRGRIVTAAAVPVIGAAIGALPADQPKTSLGFQRSNESGAFLLQIRPDVSLIDILVVPPGFATIMGRMPVRTDKALEIAVAQNGGALVAELPPSGAGLLSHEGATWSLQLVAQMAGGTDETTEKRRRVAIPSLHPGHYSLCFHERCTSGYVPPHGTLRLALE